MADDSVPSAGYEEVHRAAGADGDPNDPHDAELEDLSNEELLERVAELDSETYPVASRAQAALNQLEESA